MTNITTMINKPKYEEKRISQTNKRHLGGQTLLEGWKSRFDYSGKCLRSGMGAYTRAARRHVHPATVIPRLPSGHHPGRHQARPGHILQIELHLTQPRSMRAAPLGMFQPLVSRQDRIQWAASPESRVTCPWRRI